MTFFLQIPDILAITDDSKDSDELPSLSPPSSSMFSNVMELGQEQNTTSSYSGTVPSPSIGTFYFTDPTTHQQITQNTPQRASTSTSSGDPFVFSESTAHQQMTQTTPQRASTPTFVVHADTPTV